MHLAVTFNAAPPNRFLLHLAASVCVTGRTAVWLDVSRVRLIRGLSCCLRDVPYTITALTHVLCSSQRTSLANKMHRALGATKMPASAILAGTR